MGDLGRCGIEFFAWSCYFYFKWKLKNKPIKTYMCIQKRDRDRDKDRVYTNQIVNWFFTSSQPRRLYQGDLIKTRQQHTHTHTHTHAHMLTHSVRYTHARRFFWQSDHVDLGYIKSWYHSVLPVLAYVLTSKVCYKIKGPRHSILSIWE